MRQSETPSLSLPSAAPIGPSPWRTVVGTAARLGAWHRALSLATLIVLFAGLLRTYAVGRPALRGDEAFSVSFVSQPPASMLAGMARIEPNPPLYYMVLYGWVRLAGKSEVAVRWPSVLAGVVAVALTYRLGRAWAGRGAGALAALLAAASPALVWYGQDARVYSLLIALSAAATWLTWRAALQGGRTRWVAAGGLWWLAVFAHYFAALAFAACLLAVWLAPQTRRRWRAAAGLALGVCLAYLPWAAYVAPLMLAEHKAWITPLIGAEALWRTLAMVSAGMATAGGLPSLRVAGAVTVGLLSLLGVLWVWRRSASAAVWALASALGLPLSLWLLSAWRPVYTEQYASPSFPALLVLAAAGIGALRRLGRAGSWLGTGTAAGCLLIGLLSLNNYYFDPAFAKSNDWRGLARYLAETARPGEVVVLNLPEPAFYLYYAGPAPAVTSPPRPLDEASQPEAEAQLAALRGEYQHIRFIFQPYGGYDPDGFVGAWLDDCCEKTFDGLVRGFHVRAYDTPGGSLAARQPYAVEFDGGLALTGYRLVKSELRPGDALHLTLYWTARAPVPASYTVFVHLLAPDGFDVLDADSLPAAGRRPTDRWAVGQTVIDPHQASLPADLPPGAYRLEVGLYQLATGERLLGRETSGRAVDAVVLPVTVTVMVP